MSSISVTKHKAKDTFGCPFCVPLGHVFISYGITYNDMNTVREVEYVL